MKRASNKIHVYIQEKLKNMRKSNTKKSRSMINYGDFKTSEEKKDEVMRKNTK